MHRHLRGACASVGRWFDDYLETPPFSVRPILSLWNGWIPGCMEYNQPFQTSLPPSVTDTWAAGLFGLSEAEVMSFSPILKSGRNASTFTFMLVFGTACSEPTATMYSLVLLAVLSSIVIFTDFHFAATSFGTTTLR